MSNINIAKQVQDITAATPASEKAATDPDSVTTQSIPPGLARQSMNNLVINRQHEGLHEELRKLLGHLHAQTMLISGEGLENFCNHSEQIRSDYLWAMTDTAARALKLLEDSM